MGSIHEYRNAAVLCWKQFHPVSKVDWGNSNRFTEAVPVNMVWEFGADEPFIQNFLHRYSQSEQFLAGAPPNDELRGPTTVAANSRLMPVNSRSLCCAFWRCWCEFHLFAPSWTSLCKWLPFKRPALKNSDFHPEHFMQTPWKEPRGGPHSFAGPREQRRCYAIFQWAKTFFDTSIFISELKHMLSLIEWRLSKNGGYRQSCRVWSWKTMIISALAPQYYHDIKPLSWGTPIFRQTHTSGICVQDQSYTGGTQEWEPYQAVCPAEGSKITGFNAGLPQLRRLQPSSSIEKNTFISICGLLRFRGKTNCLRCICG